MAISGTDLLEVATTYKAYFSGLCKGISPENMANNMVLTYLHFRILKYPLKWVDFPLQAAWLQESSRKKQTIHQDR